MQQALEFDTQKSVYFWLISLNSSAGRHQISPPSPSLACKFFMDFESIMSKCVAFSKNTHTHTHTYAARLVSESTVDFTKTCGQGHDSPVHVHS